MRPTGGKSWRRTVAVVVLPDGCTLQAALVGAGLAWVDDRFCRSPECDNLRQAQSRARAARRGLWADDAPVPPWQWRKMKKSPDR
ncbi:thermonuclease family protein [uncultured Desulfovibrio sp.]|uniref:thermonuclease family protein n=1 Tax=uncultured Desulfovibrio sp. TaxID=167968 RepID=UPI00344C0623